MKLGHVFENWTDQRGNPAGGVSFGTGFCISWQNGPLGRGDSRREPNGAFVEDVLDAVIKRIEFYQDSRFSCAENASALSALRTAAKFLDDRTRDRESRSVEGVHEV